jgi:hypothetical protein
VSRIGVDPAFGGVGCTHDLDPAPLGEREIHDLIGCVIGAAGQDDVAALELEGTHGLSEGDSRVLHHGDVSSFSTEQPAHG